MSNVTIGGKLSAEITALLKARNSLIWVVTPEEGRVERAVIEAIGVIEPNKYDIRLWDCHRAVTDVLGKQVGSLELKDAMAMLNTIQTDKTRAVWVLRDLHKFLPDPYVNRAVKSIARALSSAPTSEARTMIVLSPSSEVPPELADLAVVVKWELPDREEIARIFDTMIAGLPESVRATAAPEGVREAAIEAAVGLSAEAAQSCYARSLVTQGKKIVPSVVAEEKRRIINKESGIEWFDPDPRGLDAIGGLDNLKPWLIRRKVAFTQKAREFGLPVPKGMFLVGVSGCGKSLTAKATATVFDCPLLRADMGAAQSKWVGESQANIRKVFKVAEAVGRCVLWIDEIEKALAGAVGGAADGGVSADALGTFLQWMQERKGAVFVIATSNDVSQLPPELLRKGRWDEMFFVDLPTRSERREILEVTLKQYKRDPSTIDLDAVAVACQNFNGAEIAALLPEALFLAFEQGQRALTTEDLIEVSKTIVPLANTAADKVEALRKWAKTRARRASREEVESAATEGRKLDF